MVKSKGLMNIFGIYHIYCVVYSVYVQYTIHL